MNAQHSIDYSKLMALRGSKIKQPGGAWQDFTEVIRNRTSNMSVKWATLLRDFIDERRHAELRGTLSAIDYNNVACARAWYTLDGTTFPYRETVEVYLTKAQQQPSSPDIKRVIEANLALVKGQDLVLRLPFGIFERAAEDNEENEDEGA